MLAALSIRDFVIVEHLELEFGAGFTVLTGETGAGKSILIEALQFVLGERTGADAVREGAARAEVAAEFQGGEALAQWLEGGGFAPSSADGATPGVLVRRTLEAAGRSRAFINGGAATLGQLRELGALLLDVHGQHEHQLLLRPAAQQQLLDRHGALVGGARDVAAAYAAWQEAVRQSAAARAARAQDAMARDHLEQIAQDLDALAPEPGEWERIEAEQTRLSHAAALLEGARGAVDAIAEADDALQPRLARLAARLGALRAYDERLGPALAALEGADVQLEEAARELNQYLDRSELDDARLAAIEARVGALHACARKWRSAPAELPRLRAQTRERLQGLERAQDLERLQEQEAAAAAHYQALARQLSRARAEAAGSMGREVTRAMQDLAMTGGRFEVALAPCEPAAAGLEKTEFLVSGHGGASARPLARVASGGELSRIGLAIAVIAASANLAPTLIFDEVDAGIGGQVAATVGRLLHELGRSRQVFCVTHLPQVAAWGDQHLAVRKSRSTAGAPVSRTELLDGAARTEEIARMLGGESITRVTLAHARELLGQRGA